jgi:hypothetical protein
LESLYNEVWLEKYLETNGDAKILSSWLSENTNLKRLRLQSS